jgi:esterase FrsA
VAVQQIARYVRPYAEAKANMLERARKGTFEYTDYDVVAGVLDRLTSLDRDPWAAAFMAVARPYEASAQAAETRGDVAAARADYLRAFAYYRLGRYPTTNSAGRRTSYMKSVENYLKAARYFDPPLERVEIPFAGRPGEGDRIVGYYRRPPTAERVPILLAWGGIDGYKEDRRVEAYLARGIGVLALDNAGVGEAPIQGAADADRLWDTIFDWVAARDDVDAARVAIMGSSTGGYWAAKLAHTRRERVRCAVNHGGCTHFAFTPEWIEQAQHGEYAFELAETLSYAFLRGTFEEWVAESPKLSLLTQGVLDQPCAPLLCVNGTQDSIFPISDMYLLMEHGDPKWGFFPAVGHMGHTPRTAGVILDWICGQLGV